MKTILNIQYIWKVSPQHQNEYINFHMQKVLQSLQSDFQKQNFLNLRVLVDFIVVHESVEVDAITSVICIIFPQWEFSITHPFHNDKVFALIKKIQKFPALCQVLTGIRDRAVNKTAKISTLMKLLFCGRQTIYKINKSNTVRQIMTSKWKNKAGKACGCFSLMQFW